MMPVIQSNSRFTDRMCLASVFCDRQSRRAWRHFLLPQRWSLERKRFQAAYTGK